MANIEQFADYVLQHATDVDESIAQFHIQDAVVDFLIDTKLATGYYRFNMSDKVHDYVLDLPHCHVIIDVKRVRVGSRCDETVDWDELKKTAKPERFGYYTDIDNDGMPAIWVGQPCEKSDIEVEYTYTIGRETCDVPDFVYNKYARAIQYSALSRIYAIPGQEWSNHNVSVNYLRMYETEVSKIKRKTRTFESGKLRSKPFVGGGTTMCCGGFFR